MAGGLEDWESYVAAIIEADEYWAVEWGWEAPVIGETNSWLNTITLGRAVVRRANWSELSKEDFYLLLGRGNYGQLGFMGGAGHANNVFNEATAANLSIRRTIRNALQPAIDATDAQFAEAAPSPANVRERLLAGARAAIFDALVYDPAE